MKIVKFILFALLLIYYSTPVNAQKKIINDNYRRNSLCLGYIVEGLRTDREKSLVLNVLKQYQISDKFNDHSIGWMIVNPSIIELSLEDEMVDIKSHINPIKMGTLMTVLKSSEENEKYWKEHRYNFEVIPRKLIKFAKQNNIANQLVAKWFNPSQEKKDGSFFNMELIKERGAYSASELEKLRSKESVRGMAILKDAGMDLIPNTYLAIVRLKYMSAQDHYNRTADRWDNSGVTATTADGRSVNPFGIVSGLKRKSGENQAGYYIDATIYLFKLIWDEISEDEFIQKYWEISDVNTFINEANYSLEFLDSQTSQARIKANTGINTKYENSIKLIKAATYRAIDNGLARLQKKYPNFAVMAPVIDVDDKAISAFIGLKEGLNKGDKYEIYEKVYNEEKNTYRYKKIETVEVDKNRIWDNRYDLDGNYVGRSDSDTKIVLQKDNGREVTIDTGEDKIKANPDVDRTYFKGNVSKIAPGMLIKQKGK